MVERRRDKVNTLRNYTLFVVIVGTDSITFHCEGRSHEAISKTTKRSLRWGSRWQG